MTTCDITSSNCCCSYHKQVIPCQHLVLICKLLRNFLEFTSWHPRKTPVRFRWQWKTKRDRKHSHRFNMFIYEVTQRVLPPGNSAPQAQPSCSRITYFVIPTALNRNRIWKGIIFVYTMLPFPVWESLSGISCPITQMLSGVAGLVYWT